VLVVPDVVPDGAVFDTGAWLEPVDVAELVLPAPALIAVRAAGAAAAAAPALTLALAGADALGTAALESLCSGDVVPGEAGA
jgi:hypothetical protein